MIKNIINLFNQKDKLQHILCALIIFTFSFLIANKFLSVILSLVIALVLVSLCIFGKELFDKYVKKQTYDKQDIIAGYIGVIIGIIQVIILIL